MGENTDKPPVKSQLFSQGLSGGEIENEKNEGDMRNSVGGKKICFSVKIQSKLPRGLVVRRRGVRELAGTLSPRRNVNHGFRCSPCVGLT